MAPEHLDRIFIRDLLLRTIVGVFDEERHDTQDIVLNITLHVNLQKAGISDALRDTVDYKSLKKRIKTYIESGCFNLIERIAEEVAAICLEDKRVQTVDVTVDKPGALRYAKSVAVAIERTRKDIGTVRVMSEDSEPVEDPALRPAPPAEGGAPAIPEGMQTVMAQLLNAKANAFAAEDEDVELEEAFLPSTPPAESVLARVPVEVARQYRFVPLSFSDEKNILLAAFAVAPSQKLIELLRWNVRAEIEPRKADESAVDQALATWYPQETD